MIITRDRIKQAIHDGVETNNLKQNFLVDSKILPEFLATVLYRLLIENQDEPDQDPKIGELTIKAAEILIGDMIDKSNYSPGIRWDARLYLKELIAVARASH